MTTVRKNYYIPPDPSTVLCLYRLSSIGLNHLTRVQTFCSSRLHQVTLRTSDFILSTCLSEPHLSLIQLRFHLIKPGFDFSFSPTKLCPFVCVCFCFTVTGLCKCLPDCLCVYGVFSASSVSLLNVLLRLFVSTIWIRPSFCVSLNVTSFITFFIQWLIIGWWF